MIIHRRTTDSQAAHPEVTTSTSRRRKSATKKTCPAMVGALAAVRLGSARVTPCSKAVMVKATLGEWLSRPRHHRPQFHHVVFEHATVDRYLGDCGYTPNNTVACPVDALDGTCSGHGKCNVITDQVSHSMPVGLRRPHIVTDCSFFASSVSATTIIVDFPVRNAAAQWVLPGLTRLQMLTRYGALTVILVFGAALDLTSCVCTMSRHMQRPSARIEGAVIGYPELAVAILASKERYVVKLSMLPACLFSRSLTETVFGSQACERMSCPSNSGSVCSGHGRCRSLYSMGLFRKVNGETSPTTYGSIPGAFPLGLVPLKLCIVNSAVDLLLLRRRCQHVGCAEDSRVSVCRCNLQESVSGCDNPSCLVCERSCDCDVHYHEYPDGVSGDVSDWTGYDCSLRTCPTGDSPYNAQTSVAEVRCTQRPLSIDEGFGDLSVCS